MGLGLIIASLFFFLGKECSIRRAARIAAGRVMLTNFLLRHEQASGASDDLIKDIESDAEAFYIPHICRGAEIRWSASLAFLSLTHNCYSDGLQKRAEGVIMQLHEPLQTL